MRTSVFKSFLFLNMDDNYFGNVPEKPTLPYYIGIAVLLVAAFLSVNTDLALFSERKDVEIQDWYFWLIFSIDLAIFACVISMLFQRKIGVIAMPVLVVLHFMLHRFYLSTFLYFDVQLLFVYFALGLFMVIPRWKFFR